MIWKKPNAETADSEAQEDNNEKIKDGSDRHLLDITGNAPVAEGKPKN